MTTHDQGTMRRGKGLSPTAVQAARAAAAGADETVELEVREPQWVGGGDMVLPAQQFRILYREYGWSAGRKLSEMLIRWPEGKTPPEWQYARWAREVDYGKVRVPEDVERAIKKRLDNMPKTMAFEHASETSEAAKTISRAIADLAAKLAKGLLGEQDEKRLDQLVKLSGMYQHANSGTGWVYDKLHNMSQKHAPSAQQVSIGRMTLNVGSRPAKKFSSPPKQLPAPDPEPVTEGEYTPV